MKSQRMVRLQEVSQIGGIGVWAAYDGKDTVLH